MNSLVVETALLRDIGGWDEDVVVWEHADLLLRLDPVCSVQARESIGYRMTEHHGPRNRGSDLRRARGIAGTMTKHRALFMEHARPQYAGSMRRASHHYLLAERWADAVRCAGRALMAEPTSARSYRSLMASLAGGRVARARAHRRAVQPRGADVTA